MSKFKVGDTIYVKDGAYQFYPDESGYNIPRCGMKVNICGDGYVVLNLPQGGTTPPLNPDMFSTMPPPHIPIRTVTRKEIVPGKYGIVTIKECGFIHINAMGTPENLREAAHTLNQISEAIEHD